MSRKYPWFLVALLLLLAVGSPVEAVWPYASTEEQSNFLHQVTRMKNLDPFSSQSGFFPSFGDDSKLVTIVQRYPFDPLQLNMKKAKGTAIVNWDCFSGQVNGRRSLGRGKQKFDAFGNAYMATKVSSNKNCDFYGAQTTFKGSQKQAQGSSITVRTGVQRLPPTADPDCFDATTLCLGNGGRFKVNVTWQDFQNSGEAAALATGYDSGSFWFFNPANVEMTVKVLDACNVAGFNNFWVFAAATTNVAFDLTVTDTETGASRVYENDLGQAAPAITDTSAFATCP